MNVVTGSGSWRFSFISMDGFHVPEIDVVLQPGAYHCITLDISKILEGV